MTVYGKKSDWIKYLNNKQTFCFICPAKLIRYGQEWQLGFGSMRDRYIKCCKCWIIFPVCQSFLHGTYFWPCSHVQSSFQLESSSRIISFYRLLLLQILSFSFLIASYYSLSLYALFLPRLLSYFLQLVFSFIDIMFCVLIFFYPAFIHSHFLVYTSFLFFFISYSVSMVSLST